MKKNIGVKAAVYPLPVLIIATYNEDGTANAMNAAWGTVADTNQVAICLSHSHKTVENIMRNKAFTVSMADADLVRQSDYFGIATGNNTPDKVAKAGLTYVKSEFVNAPVINEYKLTLECEFVSYDTETEFMFGEIKNTLVDEDILTRDGGIDIAKFRPIAFDTLNKSYVVLGEKAGNAFSDGKDIK